jgi:hypothetical protein
MAVDVVKYRRVFTAEIAEVAEENAEYSRDEGRRIGEEFSPRRSQRLQRKTQSIVEMRGGEEGRKWEGGFVIFASFSEAHVL